MCPQPLQTAAVMTLTWGEERHPKPEPFLQLVLFPGNWQQAKISWSEKTLPNMSNLQIEKKKKKPQQISAAPFVQPTGSHRVWGATESGWVLSTPHAPGHLDGTF